MQLKPARNPQFSEDFCKDSRKPGVAIAVQTPPSDFHKVTRLLRADTLDIEGIGPVRMIGIETPDGKSPKEIYGKFGQSAMSFVERAALKQDVRLEFDPANAARG